MKAFLYVFLVFALSECAMAKCECVCVNEQMQAVCESAMDLKPLCPPKICPLAPPSLKPLPPLQLPPLNMQCRQAQVYDEEQRRYVWRRVCE